MTQVFSKTLPKEYLYALPYLKKASRPERFADISKSNVDVARDLIKETERLSKRGQQKEAERILEIAKKVLNNNKKFQNMVGEILSDSR